MEDYEQRLAEVRQHLKMCKTQVREFDEDLVRRLIQTIKVNKGEKLEIQFESGIVMEQTVVLPRTRGGEISIFSISI